MRYKIIFKSKPIDSVLSATNWPFWDPKPNWLRLDLLWFVPPCRTWQTVTIINLTKNPLPSEPFWSNKSRALPSLPNYTTQPGDMRNPSMDIKDYPTTIPPRFIDKLVQAKTLTGTAWQPDSYATSKRRPTVLIPFHVNTPIRRTQSILSFKRPTGCSPACRNVSHLSGFAVAPCGTFLTS